MARKVRLYRIGSSQTFVFRLPLFFSYDTNSGDLIPHFHLNQAITENYTVFVEDNEKVNIEIDALWSTEYSSEFDEAESNQNTKSMSSMGGERQLDSRIQSQKNNRVYENRKYYV